MFGPILPCDFKPLALFTVCTPFKHIRQILGLVYLHLRILQGHHSCYSRTQKEIERVTRCPLFNLPFNS